MPSWHKVCHLLCVLAKDRDPMTFQPIEPPECDERVHSFRSSLSWCCHCLLMHPPAVREWAFCKAPIALPKRQHLPDLHEPERVPYQSKRLVDTSFRHPNIIAKHGNHNIELARLPIRHAYIMHLNHHKQHHTQKHEKHYGNSLFKYYARTYPFVIHQIPRSQDNGIQPLALGQPVFGHFLITNY